MAPRLNLQNGPGRKIFDLLFWVGLAAQAVLALVVNRPWMTGDSDFYLRLAESLDQGFYGWLQGGTVQPDALRPPGYPIALWLLLHRLHASVGLVVALQMALYVASILLIDRRLGKDGFSLVPFRVLALIYPFGAIYSGFVMTEAWAMLALTGLALLVSSKELTTPKVAFAGAVAGLATLFRSDLLLLPMIVAIIAIIRDWRGIAAPMLLWRALVPVLAGAAMLAPYAVWNARQFDRPSPIPVASAVGNSLYLATWQGKIPLDDLNALYGGVVTPRVERAGLDDEIRSLNASFGADPLTPPFNPAAYPTAELQRQSSHTFGRAAVRRIIADPGDYALHVVRNLWALWNTSAYPSMIPAIGRLGLIVISALVCIAGLIGLLVTARSRRPIAAAGLILLYPMVIHLPLHTEARYTAAVRPLLLMFAALAVLWLVTCYRERRWHLGRREAE